MRRIIGAAIATIAIATLFRWLAGPATPAPKAGSTDPAAAQRTSAAGSVREAALEPERADADDSALPACATCPR
jgi:hypothetical protein